jgi:hypothetical protein
MIMTLEDGVLATEIARGPIRRYDKRKQRIYTLCHGCITVSGRIAALRRFDRMSTRAGVLE